MVIQEKDKEGCPICEMGRLTPNLEIIDVTYRGQLGRITSYYSKCSVCKSEIADHTQAKENKRLIGNYKSYIDLLIEGCSKDEEI